MKALIRVTGAVQGIGYRPFVAELANEYALCGEVKNCGGIVIITAEGEAETVKAFYERLKISHPSGSIVLDVSLQILDEYEPEGPKAFSGFHIVQSSEVDDEKSLPVFPPDIGICDDCLRELTDHSDRRYAYPLISCASCGPRYSILKKLPYDRDNITMDIYDMCPECAEEYRIGRRRHAQTISCHNCGPQMIYLTSDGQKLYGETAVDRAISDLSVDRIIGLKGIGGYQLVLRPFNESAVKRLRDIKGREQKPFAILFPDIDLIQSYCRMSNKEQELLESSARPIVLLDKDYNSIKSHQSFAANVCGKSRQIGAFLPSSGIHKMITDSLGPLIVTSGNISGEAMIISDDEFKEKFADKIDGILYYEREILRPLDDSVVQVIQLNRSEENESEFTEKKIGFGNGNHNACEKNSEICRFIRRARGYVPLPIFLNKPLKKDHIYYAHGADLKNTFAIGYGDRILPGQFLGDMESMKILDLHRKEIESMKAIFRVSDLNAKTADVIADMHPGYISVNEARSHYKKLTEEIKTKSSEENVTFTQIQHHHAHIGSAMAEHGLTECIGVAFDGTGFGTDATIWGSEILICRGAEFERAEHLRPVMMVGQNEAMKNASVTAACYLLDAGIEPNEDVIKPDDKELLKAALINRINAYPNSGMGRLFDAVSCILGIADYNSYEGECAQALQNAAEEYLEDCNFQNIPPVDEFLDFPVNDMEFDSRELIKNLVAGKESGNIKELAYRFHNTIAYALFRACSMQKKKTGLNKVALSGGVFANRLLLRLSVQLLEDNGFVVYLNNIMPTNDACICVGQVYLQSLRKD